jgi:hypothetical protein
MRTIITIAAACFTAGLLQLSSADTLMGQQQMPAEVRSEAYRQWSGIANGRTEFDIADPALVPSQLALAASKAGCRWRDVIEQVPLHVFKIDNRRFAKVYLFRLRLFAADIRFVRSDKP